MIYLWEVPENKINKVIDEYDRACSPDRFLLRAGRKFNSTAFNPMPLMHFEIPKREY
ncbi:MAG: hypothetical protein H0U73_13565 [Tatlockia sp.]|nr:hypothetical protein [Tatlockia sp.]